MLAVSFRPMVQLGRSQSRIIAILTLLVFGGIGMYLVKSQEPIKKIIKKNQFSNAEFTSTGFILHNFQRTETKNGKTIWKVQAELGEYIKGQESAKLSRPFLVLYQENGDIIEVTANEAILTLDGNALKVADLQGDVVMNINRERFVNTQTANYDKSKDLITAPGYVKIEDKNMLLEGELMKVLVSQQEMTLGRNVKTTIKKRALTE